MTLGATKSDGLPAELFTSAEARWLGVQVAGQPEQPRTLLLSVPYALKAGDAETIGGLPPSAFLLAPGTTNSAANTGSSSVNSSSTPSAPPPLAGSGTLNFIPLWTPDGNTLGNSTLFQSGSGSGAKVGIGTTTPATTLDVKGSGTIRGSLTMPAVGTATATTGKNSQPVNYTASAFNSGTSAAVTQTFRWQSEPSGNNTSTPSGTFNLLFGSGSATPTETGLKISNNGVFTFADGQTFPGAGTITGITAGTALTGGGSSGNVTLSVDTTQIPQLSIANTFTGNQTISGNLSATGVVTGNSFNIGSNLFAFGSYANYNAFLGFAGNSATTGTGNTGVGQSALSALTSASGNTALGEVSLSTNTTGPNNTAVGALALQSNTIGSSNTAVGWSAMGSNVSGGYNTGMGIQALAFNTTGSFNTATGNAALAANTTGTSNTAAGNIALRYNSTGSYNTAVGDSALENTTTSSETAVGYSALKADTTGAFNTATGYLSLAGNTTGGSNAAAGDNTLTSNVAGGQNAAFGSQALYYSTGSNNTATGFQALNHLFFGDNNTAIGSGSLLGTWTGSSNTGVGYYTLIANNATNSTAIGAFAEVDVSNAMVLGSINGVNNATADTLVGIGITAPTYKLHVGNFNNAFRVEGPFTSGTGGMAASFGGWGDFGIDAPGNPSARFVVKENGRVGIGTASPDALLSVNGIADKIGGGSWGTFSDVRLKDLHGDFNAGLAAILKLHPVRYSYKQVNGMGIRDMSEHVGFVAQDVQKVIPEAVSENDKGYLLVNNDPILWTMLNAIKEQQREIAELRAQLQRKAHDQANLESRLAKLENTQRARNSGVGSGVLPRGEQPAPALFHAGR